jgi:hypothetical protein
VPGDPGELARALGAWAAAEEIASADELVDACFVLSTPADILAALIRGEPVETTFDVVDFLFSSGHGQGGAGEAKPAVLADVPDRDRGSPPASVPGPVSLRRVGGPRDELLALASVAASDGEASPEDLEVLAKAAAMRGIPPLDLAEIRVRRPAEIDPPPTLVQRERLVEEMLWMAWSDDQLDESEVRVVRDFARAWGVDPQRVTEWTAIATSRGSSRIARWIDRVGYFLFPGW